MRNSYIDQASIYTDIHAARKLQNKSVDRVEAVTAAAKQFEAMMMNQVLKSMRSANAVFEADSPFHSPATKVFRDMMDNQLSLGMSQQKGFGLAEMLARQLMSREMRGTHTPSTPEGGRMRNLQDYPRRQFALYEPLRQPLEDAVNPGVSNGIKPQQSLLDEVESTAVEQVMYYAEQLYSSEGGQPATTAPMPSTFESPQHFVNSLYPAARNVAEKIGVNPAVLLAQSALETGWGKHMINNPDGSPSYNLFGIKASRQWHGDTADILTTEFRDGQAVKERAQFRSYASFEESFADYLSFLKTNPRYQEALEKAANPGQFAEELQAAGYATDPMYAAKIKRILQSDAVAQVAGLHTPDSGQAN